MPNLKKKLWKEYSKGKIKVYIIDGTALRSQDIRFTMGCHDLVYDYVPKGEIWIASELNEHDRKCTLLHELYERRKMAQGMSYDDAHELANELEVTARKECSDVVEMIEAEIKKEPVIIGGATVFNGTRHYLGGKKGFAHGERKPDQMLKLKSKDKGNGISSVR